MKQKDNRIFIYGDIGFDWWSGGDNSADGFMKRFREAEEAFDSIELHINSSGGSIFDGLPIYNLVRHSRAEVTTFVDGCAFSMAGIIALAGAKVKMYEASLLHIHSPLAGLYGNAEQMRGTADELDTFEAPLVASVAARCKKKKEDVKALWFDYKDHFFTPEEALEAGLIDEIVSEKAVFPKGMTAEKARKMPLDSVREAYKAAYNRPKEGVIRRLFGASKEDTKKQEPFKIINRMEEIDISKIIELLGLSETATEDEILGAISSMQEELAELKKKEEDPEGQDDPSKTPDPAPEVAALKKIASQISALYSRMEEMDKTVKDLAKTPEETGGGARKTSDFKARGLREQYAAWLGEGRNILD